MKVLDIFCGTKSIKAECDKRHWEYESLDIEQKFHPTYCVDFLTWDYKSLNYTPDLIWFSPDCSVYSMASGYTHWHADHQTRTDKARLSLKLLQRVKDMIAYFDTKFIIENPRARMRWFITEYPRHTVSYCRYGFDRMKPTDIWTNLTGFTPQMCNYGNPDHIAAPRGSLTGTQGIPRSERYKVPPDLIKALFDCL